MSRNYKDQNGIFFDKNVKVNGRFTFRKKKDGMSCDDRATLKTENDDFDHLQENVQSNFYNSGDNFDNKIYTIETVESDRPLNLSPKTNSNEYLYQLAMSSIEEKSLGVLPLLRKKNEFFDPNVEDQILIKHGSMSDKNPDLQNLNVQSIQSLKHKKFTRNLKTETNVHHINGHYFPSHLSPKNVNQDLQYLKKSHYQNPSLNKYSHLTKSLGLNSIQHDYLLNNQSQNLVKYKNVKKHNIFNMHLKTKNLSEMENSIDINKDKFKVKKGLITDPDYSAPMKDVMNTYRTNKDYNLENVDERLYKG